VGPGIAPLKQLDDDNIADSTRYSLVVVSVEVVVLAAVVVVVGDVVVVLLAVVVVVVGDVVFVVRPVVPLFTVT